MLYLKNKKTKRSFISPTYLNLGMVNTSLCELSIHLISGGGFPCPLQLITVPLLLVKSTLDGGSSIKLGPCICEDGILNPETQTNEK